MKLGLISSAFVGTHVGTAEGIRVTKDLGFDTIDIFGDPVEMDAREKRLIRDTCEEVSLPVVSTVCCALGIADFAAVVRRFHIDRAKRFLDFGYDLRGRNLLLVLGEYIWQQEVIAPRDQWAWAVEGVREIATHAASLELEIALEIEPFALSIINNAEKMGRFLDDVNHPAAKANIDISHLVLAHDPPQRIAQLLAGRIAHVHISDCDGKVHGDLPPGRGCVQFQPYLSALRDTGFNGSVSIELEYSPEPAKIVDWVREACVATAALMEELSIRDVDSR
ncbi:MAG: sugar phosphate isomerase/epimerase [Bryobacteraceae bacterium]|nr:sugar phosphate isomerase/epimerase [Bryobacteraceae bacterium]